MHGGSPSDLSQVSAPHTVNDRNISDGTMDYSWSMATSRSPMLAVLLSHVLS
jgi:hypothetical protein